MENANIKNSKTEKVIQESTKRIKSHGFFAYVTIGSLIILSAILLGNLTNKFIDYLSNKINIINTYIKIAVQIITTVSIVYTMKQLSPYIHKEPQESYSYDILFITIYISSQANLSNLLKYFIK